MAAALRALGTERSFVVHGHAGLDEISTTGPTDVHQVTVGGVLKHVWQPEDFGVRRADLSALKGGDARRNAVILREILEGQTGAKRDIVLVNAAAGLIAAGLCADLGSGMEMAAKSIDSGAALKKLELLRQNLPL
jgi:anthranilate phosphoribosyltransferase